MKKASSWLDVLAWSSEMLGLWRYEFGSSVNSWYLKNRGLDTIIWEVSV